VTANHFGISKSAAARLAVGACLAACGGNDPSTIPAVGAAAPTTTSGVLKVGTAIEVMSGETGDNIDGAVLTINGRDYTTAEGRFALTEAVSLQCEVRIVAPGMLERRTLLRNLAETRFALWPQMSDSGMDEDFTRAIVYSHANGAGPLRRLTRGTTRVVIVPSRELREPEEMTAHREAAERITAANGGQVTYVVETQRPASGVYVETRLGRDDDELCQRDNILAFEQDFIRNDESVRGVIVFCDPKSARTAVVSHEMGHTFGLYHSPHPGELMYAFFDGHGAVEFSARESLEMRLMLQRPGGNQFPDDDRSVALTGATGTRVTVCPGSGLRSGRSAPVSRDPR
jgi:prepilin-type processing-associated H-X9-DG protein